MEYPKVLIVGTYFTTESGGGITMTNLFKGWPKENIAVAAAADIYRPDFSVCDNYYFIGSQEIVRRFPFNLNIFKRSIPSGQVGQHGGSSTSEATEVTESKYKKLYYRFLHFTGLFHYKRRNVISKNFQAWLEDFSPDIIYTQLSNIELIEFVKDLHEKFGIPFAIHIMDDWPFTISEKGLFQSFWFKAIDTKFRKLLSQAKVLMSISEAMSEEYMKRYGLNFIPFHNPIDIKHWAKFCKNNYSVKNPFTILYAGRIGIGIKNCFFDLIESIESLIAKGLKIQLHIQATNADPLLDDLKKFNFVKINPKVPYGELPKIFSNADLLLLPNDFDSNSIIYLKYSMPTKASEYMASGTPVLIYSSIETAVSKHAIKYKWALVVSERNTEKLANAISDLYKNEALRSKLGNAAKEYASINFDGENIREQYKKSFKISQKEIFENH